MTIVMRETPRRRVLPLAWSAALLVGLASALAACGALDVNDPTAIEEQELENASGAAMLRIAALKAFAQAVGDGSYTSGLLADEFLYDLPPWVTPGTSDQELLDRRASASYEQTGFDGGYYNWQAARKAATAAMPKLRDYAPAGAAQAQVGEMFALRGYAALRLAEDFCPGFPLHDVVDYTPVFGGPLSTDEALTKALADFDSAVAAAADSARVLHFAQVGRARALLELGRFEEASAAVTEVPTDYVAKAEYLLSLGLENRLAFGLFGDLSQSVADREGDTGLDFLSADDLRVPADSTDSLGIATDGVTPIYRIPKYRTEDAPIVLASGIEARLIQAEAALNANQVDTWAAILNDLRANAGAFMIPAVPALPALSADSTSGLSPARLDVMFRERAFWLFATGHRLADLRRLVRVYNRQPESVFPTGDYRTGGVYETGTSIPFPAAVETPYSPAVTGCTSR